jgi:outer membrane protein OmpA-like peptidoglycan-associated protein
MKEKLLYIFIFLIVIPSEVSWSQVILNKGDLEVRFLKPQVDVVPGKSFFNVLLIKNNSTEERIFNLQINTPKNWEIVGDASEKITLPPLGNLKIPVRVTVDRNAKGGVGYAIVAVLNDSDGNLYDSEYAFLNIPVSPELNLITEKGNRYLDHKYLKSKFSITIENKGNIDETLNIKLNPDISLTVENENLLITDVFVESGTSKSFTYEVELKEEIDFEKFKNHKLFMTITGSDTVISKTVWFKYLDWKYYNSFPDNNVPLTIELSAYNIFSNLESKYRGIIYGKILFKNKIDLFYSFENLNRNSQNNNLYLNSRIRAELTTPKTFIFLGDYTGHVEQTMFGRGIFVSQRIADVATVNAVFTQRMEHIKNNYGFYYNHQINKTILLEAGTAYTDDRFLNINSFSAYGKFNFGLMKGVHISGLYGRSHTNDGRISLGQYSGWGFKTNLTVNLDKINIKIISQYGSPTYAGFFQGRNDTKVNAVYTINKNNYLNTTYSLMYYNPLYIENNEIRTDRFTSYQELRLIYNYRTFGNVQFYVGPNILQQSTNSFSSLPVDSPLTILSPRVEAGVRYFDNYSYRSVSLNIKYGYNLITEYSNYFNGSYYDLESQIKPYPTSDFTFSYKQKYFGVHFVFHNGPYNINQQFSQIYYSFQTKTINIIPSFERSFFKKQLNVIVRGSYVNDITSKNNRFSVMSGVEWFAGKGWTIRFINTSSFQRNLAGTGLNAINTSYSSTYFELGIIKAFHFDQPRLKFHNYNALFYKDLNGNRIHDPNEPGVANVLTDIQRKDPRADAIDPNYNGEFITNELLSNPEGIIQYENMPEGEYIIKYSAQGLNLGTFETDEVKQSFKNDKDTVMYIPFMERNKLYGRVNLNRTKHSALGDIPLDNIKITVEGDEKTYSTLTDKDGYFELFIPVSDYYKVKINNIFFEHFNIRQDYFIVKFNGYKQFEISFDFDEKERTIQFDESDFLVNGDETADGDFSFEDIKVIKQTNLKGAIKDANSLLPLHANISVYNGKNELISETASSNRTGIYFTSFFAGENYSIRVFSKGYWVHKEFLNIQQVTTFENLTTDVMLKKINIDEEIKTDNLRFSTENSELSPLAKAELDNIITLLFLNPQVHIEISGHADNIEALIIDPKRISESRAKAVAAYLTAGGIQNNRIKIVAMGSTRPVTKDDTEDSRARNRRVEIRIAAY